MRLSTRSWLWVALGLVVVFELSSGVLEELATVVLAVSASVIAIVRSRTFPLHSRRPWRLIGIAGLMALVGNAIRFIEAESSAELYVYPSWGDPLVVATYVVLFVALAQFVRRRSMLGESSYMLDALVAVIAVGALTYWGFVEEYLSDPTIAAEERLINAGYWLLNLGVIAGAARLAVGGGQRPRSYYLLLAGIVAFSATDLLTFAYVTGAAARPLFEVFTPVVYVLLAAAVLDDTAPQIADRPIASEVRFTRTRMAIFAATVLLAPLIAALVLGRGDQVGWSLAVGLPVFLALLALARFATLLVAERDRDRRATQLRQVERQLLASESPDRMIETALEGALQLLPNRAEPRVSFVEHSETDGSESTVVASVGRDAGIVEGQLVSAIWAGLPGPVESVCSYDSPPIDLPFGADPEVLVYQAPVGHGAALRGSLVVTADSPLRRGDLDMIDRLGSELGEALNVRQLMDQLYLERAERRFKTLVQNSSDIVMVLDDRDRIVFVSPAVEPVLGRAEEELLNRDIRLLAVGDDVGTLDRFVHTTRAGASEKPIEIQTRRADGALRWFELLGRDHSDNEEIDGVVVTARDITDRKAADDRLARSEARFRSLVQHSSDVIAVIDGSGIFAYVTPSVTSALGYRSDSLVGMTVFDLVAPGHRDRVEERLALITEPFTRVELELDVKAASGRYHTLVVTLTDLRDEPAVDGIVLNARDVTQHRSLEKDLEHQSVTDPLTGLPNRTGFISTLQHVLDDPNAPSPTVLLLDLDDFKMLNDTLGHSFGDDILNVVADRLRTSLRLSDHAGRLGGDEFGVLLRDAYTQTDVVQVTERLLEDLGAPLLMRGEDISLSASVGIVMAGSADSAEDLLRNADAAMYRAKDAGKDRFEMFEEQIHTEMIERLELKNDLRRGISNDELVLHFQPIVNLESDRITGAEALVRWDHPRRGVLAPGAFIEMAEESGLINRIGAWVFEQACLQVMEWNERRGANEQLTMSINLSARQLEADETVDELLAIADRIAVPRDMIVLELTESVLIDDSADRARLTRLQGEGFRLAVDDFGTGYSGLAYLQKLPFDIIKVDRAFVTGVDTNVNRAAFLESILELAKGLGAKTIGEGIEGGGELELLKKLGFDFGQGYYFSRPVPSDTFATMIGMERALA